MVRLWHVRPALEKPKKQILAAQDGRGQHRRASAAPICAKLFWLVRLRERIVRRREFIALVSSPAAIRSLSARAERPPERILYFTYSAGYRHDSIPLSKAILTQLGRNSGSFEVTATEDTSEFSTENLERYAAGMFYTTGELPISGGQKAALLNFVRSGCHSACNIDPLSRGIGVQN